MSLTLSFDTSADFCSAAFVLDGKVICECSKELSRGHAENLVPMIKDLGKNLGVEISDADLISVTIGPGSYTGVRTGLSAARGFSLVSGAPAVGVSKPHRLSLGRPKFAIFPRTRIPVLAK